MNKLQKLAIAGAGVVGTTLAMVGHTFAQTAVIQTTAQAVLGAAATDVSANITTLFQTLIPIVIGIIVLFFGFSLVKRKVLGAAR